ncbi:DUF1573 domain-containing protein [uncultured Bacteroides sp.]|uniref:DUF1573 domain-containing protein n=1 Tax=uncultured Bacteroides sp. TaxID=162156 RepID=UPI002AA6F62D|nr:DUF1573 domain-containing protein [uncultured Bacteroides sp.]
MKRCLTVIFSFFIVCLSVYSQPHISSNKETHNFGQIKWKKPVTVQYTITNTGNKVLVLTNVTTSCGCTVADWTKDPIEPGKKGVVSATFDAKALGHFDKTVGIYSNAQPSLVYLNFVGEVVEEVKDFTKTHPYLIGKIRIDHNTIDFTDVNRNDNPQIVLSVVNLSDKPYEPELMHLPPYLKMSKKPNVLLRGKRGTLTLTLDAKQLVDLGLTQTSVYLARFAGDKVNEENEIPVSVVLLPDFSGLSKQARANAPAIRLSETTVDFSSLLAKKNKASHDIVITNTGKSMLVIQKLQVFNPAVGVKLKKTQLNPGESTKLGVRLSKKGINQKRLLKILMITNDPVQPKVEINLKTK